MKKKIAIVTGGNSGEIGISLKSAGIIEKNIDAKKFSTFIIHISNKRWIYKENGHEYEVDKNDFSIISKGKKILFDAVFIAIHGTPGEDGRLQGYFDLLGIPYTSSDLTTSALTFNKFFCSQLITDLKLCHIADAVLLRKGSVYETNDILSKTGLPCFVKPNESGSSLGITKVNKAEDLQPAINLAFDIDEAVIVEQYIKGREITCGVVNLEGELWALPITEIISKNEYFDFETKYNKLKADEITPAQIPNAVFSTCQKVSKDLYAFYNCKGVVRFDYILTPDNKLYFLEVNTIPGMTDESIVPQQAAAAGISMERLFTGLLENIINKK